MNWQPIETASKDGGEMLLFCEGQITVGYFYKGSKPWHTGDWWIHGGQVTGKPSHWMPLPEPPNE